MIGDVQLIVQLRTGLVRLGLEDDVTHLSPQECRKGAPVAPYRVAQIASFVSSQARVRAVPNLFANVTSQTLRCFALQ
jgi:hypothetical protein